MKLLLYSTLWLLYIWVSAYTFTLWPWPKESLQWWCIPHLYTLIVIAVLLFRFCVFIEERVFNHV